MKPSRILLAQVAILVGMLTKPGITLAQINEDHGEHIDFMRSRVDELSRMRLLKADPAYPASQWKSLEASTELVTRHNTHITSGKPYDLTLVLEGIIAQASHRLDDKAR